MARKRALTLIVARPGPLRDGIEALLASVPEVEVLGEVHQPSRALSLAAQHSLDLLLLEAGPAGGKNWRVLSRLQGQHPGLRSIVLADDIEQVRQARAAGADAVFLKGFPPHRFVRTVERLVSRDETRKPESAHT